MVKEDSAKEDGDHCPAACDEKLCQLVIPRRPQEAESKSTEEHGLVGMAKACHEALIETVGERREQRQHRLFPRRQQKDTGRYGQDKEETHQRKDVRGTMAQRASPEKDESKRDITDEKTNNTVERLAVGCRHQGTKE